jgi:autotransporter-associated beta strand protein
VLTGPVENQFTGAVTVNAGTLSLNKGTPFFGGWLSANAVPGALTIGGTNLAVGPSVLLIHGDQIGDAAPVTIQPSGRLYLGGNNETFGALTMIGGLLYGDSLETTNIGTLTLTADVSVPYTPFSPSANISANLALGGGVMRTFNVQLDNFNIHGIVSDGGTASGLTKTGPGEMRLFQAANTYRGMTMVSSGALMALGSGSLGSTNNGTVVNAGAKLGVQGGVIAEAITINSGGADASIHCVANTTFTGPMRLNGTADVDVDFGVTLTISSAITGGGGLHKLGEGTLAYTGPDANTYSGATTVKGQLTLGKTTGLIPVQSIAGPLVIGEQGTTFLDVHTVRLLVANQIADTVPVTIFDGGNLDLNNRNETIGPLEIWADLHTGSGTLTLNGDVFASQSHSTPEISGRLSLGNQLRTVTVAPGKTLRIPATISDAPTAAGWIKNGIGSVDLLGANTFDGALTINAGQVWVYHGGALGSTAGATIVNVGGQLTLSDYYGSVTNREPITLNGAGLSLVPSAYGALWSLGVNALLGPITLASDTFINAQAVQPSSTGLLTLAGPVTGQGKLTQNGNSYLFLTGGEDNSHTGGTCVNGGALWLGKTNGAVAIPSALTVSNAYVGWIANNQIENDVLVTVRGTNAWVDVSDATERIGELVMDAGKISVNTGLLTLGGDVTVTGDYHQASKITGRLALGGNQRVFQVKSGAHLRVQSSMQDGSSPSGVTLTGGGAAWLEQSNSFSGPVIVDHASLTIFDNYALGRTNSGVVVTNEGQLFLYGVDVRGEALTLSDWWTSYGGPLQCIFSNSWSGPVHLVTNTTIYLDIPGTDFVLSGPISGPGGLDAHGFGSMHLTGTAPNTFNGELLNFLDLLELNKTNAVAVHGRLNNWGTVRLGGPHQILDTSEVFVADGAIFDLNGFSDSIGDLNTYWLNNFGDPIVALGNGVLTVSGAAPVDRVYGIITGAGGELDKTGPNTLVLEGDNTYTSGTLVKGGTLIVKGSQPASDVYVQAGATLGGLGTVGRLYGQGGTISPGDSTASGLGRLSVAGDVTFTSATKLRIELYGTIAGTNYDQLNVTGNLAANQATLQISMGFAGALSNRYVIINHPTGATTTAFAGLPEGAIVSANNGATFRISYAGGDGNDTVLTQVTPGVLAQFSNITPLGNGTMQLGGTGFPGATYTVQGNFDLNTTNWLNLGTITAAMPSGLLQFIDLSSTNYPMRFYRFLLP